MEHSRAVYTFWDVMGDVGGLHDALVLLGEVFMTLVSLFTGSGLDRYLVKSLFKVNPRKDDRKAAYE